MLSADVRSDQELLPVLQLGDTLFSNLILYVLFLVMCYFINRNFQNFSLFTELWLWDLLAAKRVTIHYIDITFS